MRTEKRNKIIKSLITLLFIFLPIIDILRSTFIKDIEILNISVIEFVNFLLIGIAFLLTLPKINKKKKIFLIIYLAFFLIYMIFHIFNIYQFNTNILEDAKPNLIIESYYIIRVYILPILLIVILFSNREIFNKEYYIKTLKYLIITISGTIVISNFLGYSYSSYDDEFDLINRSRFFDIFNYSGKAKELLTCGFFNSANQISIILFMLLPFNIYNLNDKSNLKNFILVILQIFSMIIIGTKTAAIGALLIALITLFAYIFFLIIRKDCLEKKYLCYHLIILFITIAIFFVSPFYSMMKSSITNEDNFVNEEEDDIEYAYNMLEIEMSDEEIKNILVEYNGVFKISSMFYKIYPIENDIEFWIKIAKRENSLNNDYRVLKTDIIKRVVQRNNNKEDKLFGIGYCSQFPDIEVDYLYQYYLFGIFGCILLIGVYIYFFGMNIVKLFHGKYFRYEYFLRIFTSFLGLVGCYFSGHLFGWTSPMIILATTLCIGRVNK